MLKAMKRADLGPFICEDLLLFGEDRGVLAMARRNVLQVLDARGLPVDDAQRSRVECEESLDRLDVWLRRAVVAPSTEEALDDRGP